jgi:hypothetical protein
MVDSQILLELKGHMHVGDAVEQSTVANLLRGAIRIDCGVDTVLA